MAIDYIYNMDLKLPFGLKEGKLVEVSEVERGLPCGCICPACSHRLVARKGDKTIHHFAHYKSAECKGALETALHMAAKETLEKSKVFRLPKVYGYIGHSWGSRGYILHEEQTIEFDKVFLEKRLDNLVPDIILELNGRQLFVEIAVTHFIDEAKRRKIKELGISTIQIHLKEIDRQISFTELENILLNDTILKEWVYNRKAQQFNDRIRALGREHKVIKGQFGNISGKIYQCPLIGKKWKDKTAASLTEDCFECRYFFSSRSGDELNSNTHILCIGHAEKELRSIISKYKRIRSQ
jgi:hypothetical protein